MQALERRTLFEASVDAELPVDEEVPDGELSSYTYPNPGGGTNAPPVVTVNNSSVSANEGSMATNTGTFTDPNYDFVTLAASLGSVSGSGSSGTWSWSYVPPDGPRSTMVVITATDSRGASAQTSFPLIVANVEPSFTLSSYSSEVYVNTTYTLLRSAVTDPGQDTITSWTINWGDGNTEVFAGNPSSFPHVYTTPGTKGITATAHDEDGSYSRGRSANVILPEVGVMAADVEASEDGRQPAVFHFSRTGPTSGALDVYFAASGSATPGVVGAGGTVTPAEADYTLSAEKVGDLYKVTIPDGSPGAAVTVTPRNDWHVEGTETVALEVAASPAAGPPLYAAAAQNPPAAQNKADASIFDLLAHGRAPGSEKTLPDADFKAEMDAIEDAGADGAAANAAQERLRQMLLESPGSETYVLDERKNYEPATQGRINNALSDALPLTVRVSSNVITVQRRHHNNMNAACYNLVVRVWPNNDKADVEVPGDGNGPDVEAMVELAPGVTSSSDVRVVPKQTAEDEEAGSVKLSVTFIPMKFDAAQNEWVQDPAFPEVREDVELTIMLNLA